MSKYTFLDKHNLLKTLDTCEGNSIAAKLRTLKSFTPIPGELSSTTVGQWIKNREQIKYAVDTGSGHRAKLTKDQMANFRRQASYTIEQLKGGLVQGKEGEGFGPLVLDEVLFDQVDVEVDKEKQKGEDASDTEEQMIEKSLSKQLRYDKTNAELIEGEGKFQSQRLKRTLEIYSSDLLKNQKDSPDSKYEHVDRIQDTHNNLVKSNTKVRHFQHPE